MKKYSKTFCALPWISMATTPTGNLRVCCNSTSGKNLILKPNKSPYRIDKDNLEEAWNSKTYQDIRQAMIDGKRHPICKQCFREEDAQVESPRQRLNKKWMKEVQSVKIKPSFSQIKYLDLRLGNKCNLKCRMCNPYSSNQMLKEWEGLTRQVTVSTWYPVEKYKKQELKMLQWPDKMDFKKLANEMPSIREIYLTGGEPLIIEQPMYQLLEHLIQNKVSKNITLKYNTNLTRISPRLLTYWEEFKKVELNVSIDGFGELNNYIRHPSRWESIEKNLQQIINWKATSLTSLTISISCTIQMYNILYLDQLLSWIRSNHLDVYFNILNHPECLNIRVLPKDLKVKAEDKLSVFKKDFPVEDIINYMNKEDWTQTYLKEFFNYTSFLDQSRKQKMKTHLPDLAIYA